MPGVASCEFLNEVAASAYFDLPRTESAAAERRMASLSNLPNTELQTHFSRPPDSSKQQPAPRGTPSIPRLDRVGEPHRPASSRSKSGSLSCAETPWPHRRLPGTPVGCTDTVGRGSKLRTEEPSGRGNRDAARPRDSRTPSSSSNASSSLSSPFKSPSKSVRTSSSAVGACLEAGPRRATSLFAYVCSGLLVSRSFFSGLVFSRMMHWCVASALRFLLLKLLQLQRRRFLEVCCDPTQRFTHILSGGRLKAERHSVRTADGYEIFFYRLARVSRHCCHTDAPRCCGASSVHASGREGGGTSPCRCASVGSASRDENALGACGCLQAPATSATGPRPSPVISRRVLPHPGPPACEVSLPADDDEAASGVCTPEAPRETSETPSLEDSEVREACNIGSRRCVEGSEKGGGCSDVATPRSAPGGGERGSEGDQFPSVEFGGVLQQAFCRERNAQEEERPLVFLQHGLLESSLNWVSGGAESLAFLLVENGCDVWLGNNRGNEYVRFLQAEQHENECPPSPAAGKAKETQSSTPQTPAARAGLSAETADESGELESVSFHEDAPGTRCVFNSASSHDEGASLRDCEAAAESEKRRSLCASGLADWAEQRLWETVSPDTVASSAHVDLPRGSACSQLCCQCTGLTAFPAIPAASSSAEEQRILGAACVEAAGTLLRLLRCSQPCRRRQARRPSAATSGFETSESASRFPSPPQSRERLFSCRRVGGRARETSAEEQPASSECSTQVSPSLASPAPEVSCLGEDDRGVCTPPHSGWWPLPHRRRHSAAGECGDSDAHAVSQESRDCFPPFSSISAASAQTWTFHDMAEFDVPAMLHHILSLPASVGGGVLPGQQASEPRRLRKVWAFGQSQGAAQLLALTSTFPGVCLLVHSLVLFSPPVVLHPLSSLSLSTQLLISLGLRHPASLLRGIKVAEALFPSPALSIFGDCVAGHRLMGFYTGDIAWQQRCINFKFTPSGGTSKLNFQHWLGIMHGGEPLGRRVRTPEARRRREAEARREHALHVLEKVADEGDAAPGPAAYPLENITCPVHAFFGGKDNLVNAEASVAYLSECVDRNLLSVDFWPEAGHLDFGWARARRWDLYPDLVRRILSHS
ncbi:triacylglycerol lipase [Toxoplasma gondii GAB2-2007-GAL-DOM2]|uniref:Triacylglycerol lipase n=2 Tax=Toxoplasma gondii TaxID=5811 RepID=A0A086KS59_TOXGO|nr:triacylglycerol lipase [Toxoplasma gondii GAB2-2007-GAL-DOM2]KFG47227.1 triacylglycerol lipase [Toxoplasma gondii FOU]